VIPNLPNANPLQPLADRLNFADTPRPFKNPHFVSKLASRTASSTTTVVRKGVKQILTLERERLSGGDGFLTASQTQQKLRGQPIDPAGKRKATGTGYVRKPKGNVGNFKKGRLSNLVAGGSASGTTTPADGDESVADSRRTTPVDDEDEEMAAAVVPPGGLLGDGFDDITPKGEVITCESGQIMYWVTSSLLRSHPNSTTLTTTNEKVLRHHRSPRFIYRPTNQAALQRTGSMACSQGSGKLNPAQDCVYS
jgi:hypothetical protein